MDKWLILAVAGAGKTTSLVSRLNEESRALLLTYTVKSADHLRSSIIRRFGFMPSGVRVYTYFTFLLKFCYKPLTGLSGDITSFNFEGNFGKVRFPKTSKLYYVDGSNRAYHNRFITYLFDYLNLGDQIAARLERFFDEIYVDEVQDYAGNDFDFIELLSKLNVYVQLVGDFYQHTFSTSRDGNRRQRLHSSYENYVNEFLHLGYNVDVDSMSLSYRCSENVCNFISENIGVKITSGVSHKTVVRFLDENEILPVFNDKSIVKLFYKMHDKYRGNTGNWGAVKGLDCFGDVCVVVNKTTMKYFRSKDFSEINEQTKNKLYVACTRAKGNLYFLAQDDLDKAIS